MSFVSPPIVYVVDDDSDIRQAICIGLRRRGMQVEDFSSAQSFLDVYDGYLPAVLVLDVEMPGMSGLVLQRELSACGYELPIIFASASIDPQHREAALEAGAVEFLAKPILADEMFSYVRAAFDRSAISVR